MEHVEQAIFTSAKTDRSAGYQVVATSPGVSAADRRELTVFGPSHDSLIESGPEAVSLNFYPLPSGAFCISRTMAAGWEYSGRGGHRVYTHCLVVPAEVLRRFANNPFAVLWAASATGAMEVLPEISPCLGQLDLRGRTPTVDQSLLTRLVQRVGAAKLAQLVQSALASPCLAVDGPVPAEELIAGLINCLPMECRTAMSFSTGLKYSSRRRFRIVALPRDEAARRWLAHQSAVIALDLAGESPSGGMLVHDWARLVGRALGSGRTALLADELSTDRPDFSPGDLPALGMQLLEELETSVFHESEAVVRHGHAAHHRFAGSGETAAAATATVTHVHARPSQCLDPQSPEIVERLEELDDAVFDAVNGRLDSLDRLRTLWPELKKELGDDLLAESREQYVRYALTVWEEGVDQAEVRDPTAAVRALDVLCVLFDS